MRIFISVYEHHPHFLQDACTLVFRLYDASVCYDLVPVHIPASFDFENQLTSSLKRYDFFTVNTHSTQVRLYILSYFVVTAMGMFWGRENKRGVPVD